MIRLDRSAAAQASPSSASGGSSPSSMSLSSSSASAKAACLRDDSEGPFILIHQAACCPVAARLLPRAGTRATRGGAGKVRLLLTCGDRLWAREELDLRPLPCQGSALPLSYAPGVLEEGTGIRGPSANLIRPATRRFGLRCGRGC